MSETNFVNGMRVSRRQTAPAFVIANLGVKVDDFIVWLRQNQDGEWMNIDIKLSKGGKYYAELNVYKKETQTQPEQEAPKDTKTSEGVDGEVIDTDDIPF